jgi:hypothetical protein
LKKKKRRKERVQIQSPKRKIVVLKASPQIQQRGIVTFYFILGVGVQKNNKFSPLSI